MQMRGACFARCAGTLFLFRARRALLLVLTMSIKETFLRRSAVEQITGLRRSSIYKFIDEGRFPKPIRIGPRAVAWLESDIAAWQQEQIKASRGSA